MKPPPQTASSRVFSIAWLSVTAAAAAILLWPAVYNRFPLVFPDTGAYFAVAWGQYWTVDRSGFYGFFLRPLSSLEPQLQLWLAVALQATLIATAILLVLRKMTPELSPAKAVAVVAALAVLTSLPWHSTQLMPDAFSGVCVLAVWLACQKDPSDNGSPSLWFAAYIAGLMHYTHLVVIVAAATATLLVQLLLCSAPRSTIAKRALAAAVVAVAILATQTTANGLFLKRWSPAPMGSAFLFARLHEDGIVQPWLTQHCPRGETPALCRAEPRLPHDSQALLWGNGSPFTRLAVPSRLNSEDQSFLAELRTASLGAILERPLQFGGNALREGSRQFVHFQVLDDECPEVCRTESSAVYGWFRDYRPSLIGPFLSSRQLQGSIPKTFFRSITTPVAALSLLVIPILFWLAWRRKDAMACSLLAAVFVALCANAFVTGALSDVHDRYQSRVIWLAPFAVLLAWLRCRRSNGANQNQGGETQIPGRPASNVPTRRGA
jgi:hypothetical protein